jgi:capsular polysaccharide biosynthesis protein
MKTFLIEQARKISFFLLTCIARLLPGLRPYRSELVLPAQVTNVTLPVNFELLPEKFARRFFQKKKINERYIHFFRDVYVNGDAVIFRNLRVYAPSLAWQPYIKWYKSGRFLVRQWLFKIKTVGSSETAALVYNQWGYENYYHWMIESLPRLLLIQKDYADALIIIPDPAPEFVKTTISLLGFEKTISLPISEMEILKINNLVFPNLEFEKAEDYVAESNKRQIHNKGTPAPFSNNGLTNDLIISVKEKILSHFPQLPVSTKKIFVSRSRQKFRRLVNEKDLEPILKKYGFEIVYFEEMSFAAQVKLMQETEILLSTHGANLVNILFLPPNAKVIEMVNKDFTNDVYYTLASDLDLSYYVIPCHMTDETLIPPGDSIILNDTANFTDQMVALNNAHLQVDISVVEETIEKALKHHATKNA